MLILAVRAARRCPSVLWTGSVCDLGCQPGLTVSRRWPEGTSRQVVASSLTEGTCRPARSRAHLRPAAPASRTSAGEPQTGVRQDEGPEKVLTSGTAATQVHGRWMKTSANSRRTDLRSAP